MIRRRLFFFVLSPIVSLCVALCYATEIIPSTLEYMTDFSDTVVIGHVTDKYSYWENKKIYTNIAIDVERFIKSSRGETSSPIELKIPGGKVGDIGFEVDQAPVFSMGEKVMLFLKKINDNYFPYGFNYGVYQIFWDDAQKKEFINGPLFNQPEYYNLRTMQAVKNREPLGKRALEPFLERVTELVK
jgi:hypothetical protein